MAEVITPVHIGTGEILLPVDFVVHDGVLYVIDVEKLIEFLPHDRVETFSSMLIQAMNMQKIFEWLNIKPADYGKYAKYVVSCHFQPSELHVSVKNANKEPYMPGSSVKGALRSAICYNLFNTPQSKRWLISETFRRLRRRNAEKSIQDFIESIFGREPFKRKRKRHSPHYDIMRFFRISDSASVDSNQIEVQKVYVIETSGLGRYKVTDLRMHVEALVPRLKTSGKITIDKTLSHEVYSEYRSWFPKCDVSTNLNTVISYANKFASDLINYEIEFASSYGIEPLMRFYVNLKQNVLQKLENNQFLLRLGWGSGYYATTIGMLLKDERIFRRIRERFELGNLHIPVFPISRRVIFMGKEMLPLGWVKFTLT